MEYSTAKQVVAQDVRRSSFGTAGLLAGTASLPASLPADRVAAEEAAVAQDSKLEAFEDTYLLVAVIGIVVSR